MYIFLFHSSPCYPSEARKGDSEARKGEAPKRLDKYVYISFSFQSLLSQRSPQGRGSKKTRQICIYFFFIPVPAIPAKPARVRLQNTSRRQPNKASSRTKKKK